MTSRVPRVTKSDAIALRHRRLGDADRIVTLITPFRGKLDVVAKGALRVRSKLAGHLEPLTHLEIVLAHGRSMDIVTQAQTRESFGSIRGDLERLASAMYFLELVDRLTVEHAEARGVYDLLLDALTTLDRGDGANFVARTFELRLLELVGFRPELQQCVSCGRDVAADEALWSALGGGVLGKECARPRGGGEGRRCHGPARAAGVSGAALRGGGPHPPRRQPGSATGEPDADAGAGGFGARTEVGAVRRGYAAGRAC